MPATSSNLVVILSILFVSLCIVFFGARNVVVDHEPNQCVMSWMQPAYAKIDFAHKFAYKYSLYHYMEDFNSNGFLNSKRQGVPVLFIHGNAGSYKQVRSLGVALDSLLTTLRRNHNPNDHTFQAIQARFATQNLHSIPQELWDSLNVDPYAIDFEEELSGLNGQLLWDQAEYVNSAIHHILHDIYKDKYQSIIVVGHSMGGIVARAAPLLNNYVPGSIKSLITLSSPHRDHPIWADASLAVSYAKINDLWRSAFIEQSNIQKSASSADAMNVRVVSSLEELKTVAAEPQKAEIDLKTNNASRLQVELRDISIVSVSGGFRDTLIRSDNTYLDDIVPPTNGISVSSYSIADVGVSPDHQCVVWCKQLTDVVARCILDTLVFPVAAYAKAINEHVHIDSSPKQTPSALIARLLHRAVPLDTRMTIARKHFQSMTAIRLGVLPLSEQQYSERRKLLLDSRTHLSHSEYPFAEQNVDKLHIIDPDNIQKAVSQQHVVIDTAELRRDYSHQRNIVYRWDVQKWLSRGKNAFVLSANINKESHLQIYAKTSAGAIIDLTHEMANQLPYHRTHGNHIEVDLRSADDTIPRTLVFVRHDILKDLQELNVVIIRPHRIELPKIRMNSQMIDFRDSATVFRDVTPWELAKQIATPYTLIERQQGQRGGVQYIHLPRLSRQFAYSVQVDTGHCKPQERAMLPVAYYAALYTSGPPSTSSSTNRGFAYRDPLQRINKLLSSPTTTKKSDNDNSAAWWPELFQFMRSATGLLKSGYSTYTEDQSYEGNQYFVEDRLIENATSMSVKFYNSFDEHAAHALYRTAAQHNLLASRFFSTTTGQTNKNDVGSTQTENPVDMISLIKQMNEQQQRLQHQQQHQQQQQQSQQSRKHNPYGADSTYTYKTAEELKQDARHSSSAVSSTGMSFEAYYGFGNFNPFADIRPEHGVHLLVFTHQECSPKVTVALNYYWIAGHFLRFNASTIIAIAFTILFFAIANQARKDWSISLLQSLSQMLYSPSRLPLIFAVVFAISLVFAFQPLFVSQTILSNEGTVQYYVGQVTKHAVSSFIIAVEKLHNWLPTTARHFLASSQIIPTQWYAKGAQYAINSTQAIDQLFIGSNLNKPSSTIVSSLLYATQESDIHSESSISDDIYTFYKFGNMHTHAALYIALSTIVAYSAVVVLSVALGTVVPTLIKYLIIAPVNWFLELGSNTTPEAADHSAQPSSNWKLWIVWALGLGISVLAVVARVAHSGIGLVLCVLMMLFTIAPRIKISVWNANAVEAQASSQPKSRRRLHIQQSAATLLAITTILLFGPALVVWVKELAFVYSIRNRANLPSGFFALLLKRRMGTFADSVSVLILPVLLFAAISSLIRPSRESLDISLPLLHTSLNKLIAVCFEVGAYYTLLFARFAVYRCLYVILAVVVVVDLAVGALWLSSLFSPRQRSVAETSTAEYTSDELRDKKTQ